MARLTVEQSKLEDVFSDIVRVEMSHRPPSCRAGQILVVRVGGRKIYAAARGAPSRTKGKIWLDSRQRERLGVSAGKDYDFELSKAGWWGEMMWAFDASNPTNRVAARFSVVGLVLGFIGLVAGVAPLFAR